MEHTGIDIATAILIASKEVLTTEEVAIYLGVTPNHIGKLTSAKQIPHYKRGNGQQDRCYFDKKEINEWLKRIKVKTIAERANELTPQVKNQPKFEKISYASKNRKTSAC